MKALRPARSVFVRWSPLLAAVLIALYVVFFSLLPNSHRAKALREETARLEADVSTWAWVREIQMPVDEARTEEPAGVPTIALVSEHVDRLTQRVGGTDVRLLRLEASKADGLFEVQVRGGYANLLRFLIAFEEAPLEVRSVKKAEDGSGLIASLHFKGTGA